MFRLQKEYLIQLVKELRSELRMRNRIDMDSSQCSRVEDDPREDVRYEQVLVSNPQRIV